jgi:tRNA-binding protein
MTIEYGDFERVDMRVGTITAVEDFPRARNPTYRLTVDLGPELGERRSSAQVTISEVLVLGVPGPEGEIVLLTPTRPVPNGRGVY